jgi:hypothetical protein
MFATSAGLEGPDGDGFMVQPISLAVEDKLGRCEFRRTVELVRAVSFRRRYERLKARALELAGERAKRVAGGDAACRAGAVSDREASRYDTVGLDAELIAIVRRLDEMRGELGSAPRTFSFEPGGAMSSEQVNADFDAWVGQPRTAVLSGGQQVIWTLDALQIAAANGELARMTGAVLCGASRWPDTTGSGRAVCPASCSENRPSAERFEQSLRTQQRRYAL